MGGGRGDRAQGLFGVADETEDDLIAEIGSVLADTEIDALIVALRTSVMTDKGQRRRSGFARRGRRRRERAGLLKDPFLTEDEGREARVLAGALRDAEPALCAALVTAQARFVELDEKLAALRTAEASGAVLALADAVRSGYERRKRAKAALDYDDLIVKALNCCRARARGLGAVQDRRRDRPHSRRRGAGHQPRAMEHHRALADGVFRRRRRASDRLRTLFAVGDEKQSIYSFQGANPARFGEVGRDFRQRAQCARVAWHDVPLTLSFRSTEPVLEAVDHVFAGRRPRDGLTSSPTRVITHQPIARARRGWSSCGTVEAESRAAPARRLRAVERGAGRRPLGRCALQAHRRARSRLAGHRRGAASRKAARCGPATF